MAKAKIRYEEAGYEVYNLMHEVIGEHFAEIKAMHGDGDPLRIKILMANNDGEVYEPCLKHHGAACVALIRKSKPQDRATGGPDVYIELDANRWDESSERRRSAILAHELRHIAFKRDKSGALKRDVYERPVIRLAPDDWILTGFSDVVEWYGQDAVEYQSACDVGQKCAQLGMSFMNEDADRDEDVRPKSIEMTPNGVSVTLDSHAFGVIETIGAKLRHGHEAAASASAGALAYGR